jgi:3-deoxy-manno-octulosonate cytidylyltransferase (CMP-KDO synthetase)
MSNKSRILGVIPARYGSSRFPGKILAKINGKPMIQRVYERASQSKLLNQLLVAVDDERVKQCVEAFGGTAIMTDPAHKSGTDRIAAVVADLAAEIVVNIQGDQPLIHPEMIDAAVEPMLVNPAIQMSTLKTEIPPEDYPDPGVVKVVVDEAGFALYFSRSLIPYPREGENLKVYEHVGTYVYRKDFLMLISRIPQTYLEKIESLEQLRVLEKGYKIFVVEPKVENLRIYGMSVDTPADLIKAEKYIQQLGL